MTAEQIGSAVMILGMELPPAMAGRKKYPLHKAEGTVFKTGNYLQASSTATATETVIPTMGLLPAPRKPIIST